MTAQERAAKARCADAGDALQRVYHVGAGRLLALPLLWGGLVALLVATSVGADSSDPGGRQALLLGAGVVTLLVLPLFVLVWNSRLVLSPEGIAHHQWAYTVRSSWANLEALSLGPGAEALLLREPGSHSALLRLAAELLNLIHLRPSLAGDLNSLAAGRFIFLAPFMAHWKRGPLREDILRWAPHLFDAAGEAKKVDR